MPYLFYEMHKIGAENSAYILIGTLITVAALYYLMGWVSGRRIWNKKLEDARAEAWEEGFAIGAKIGRADGFKEGVERGKRIGRTRGERGRFVSQKVPDPSDAE